MKKFVALALFAVMVLMMVPAANAYDGDTPWFIAYDKLTNDLYTADLGDKVASRSAAA